MKKYIVSLLLSLGYSTAFAQDIEISGLNFFQQGLTPGGPQIFIFNAQGVLVHHSKKLDKRIVKAFDKTAPIADGAATTQQLENAMGDHFKLEPQGYTVFSMMMSKENKCPPCEQQIPYLTAALKKHQDKNITVKNVVITR